MLCRLALFLCLMALATLAAGGGVQAQSPTGLTGVQTDQITISDHPHHVLMGHVIVVRQNGMTARALVIGHRRDGVHRLRFDAAWSDGHRLPYRRETGTGCTHGHCRDGPVGMILLDAESFARAMRDGLSARLTGPTGAIDIAVPASLFGDAAARAAGM